MQHKPNSSPAPFGYRLVRGADGWRTFAVDETETVIVRRLYAERAGVRPSLWRRIVGLARRVLRAVGR